jgi:hypothetical protein
VSKQVILLAGLHKTATTSIQSACVLNQNLLAAQKICYPTVVVHGKVDANHSVILREFFREAPDRMGLDAQVAPGQVFPRREQRRAKFGEQPAKFNRLLMAAEAVSVFSVRELQQMKVWFEDLGFSVRLINSHELATKHEFGPAGFFFQTIGLPSRLEVPASRANEGRSDVVNRVVSVINERFGRAHWQGPIEKVAEHIAHPGMRAIREIDGPKFALRSDLAWLVERGLVAPALINRRRAT